MDVFDRRRHSNWVALLVALCGLLLVGAIAIGVLLRARIDPRSVQRQLVEAVERDTGRRLVISGPVTFHMLPRPEIAASNITLSNFAGGSAPQMLHVQAAEADIAILPLLRRQVRLSRVTLYAPALTLERRPDGLWNWHFTRPAPVPPVTTQARAGQRMTPARAAGHWHVDLDQLRVEGGSITVLDRLGETRQTGDRTLRIDLRDLTGTEISSDHPAWRLRLLRDGVPLTFEARTGGLKEVIHGWPDSPWPIRLLAMQDSGDGSGASIRAIGTLSGGEAGRDFDLDLHASVRDLAALAPLLPQSRLPVLRDAAIAARLDGGLGAPAPQAAWTTDAHVTLHSIHVQTGRIGAGRVQLLAAAIDGAADQAPLAVHLSFNQAPTPVMLTARLGTLAQVQTLAATVLAMPGRPDLTTRLAGIAMTLARSQTVMPVDISAVSGPATAEISGHFVAAGSRMALRADIPDLQSVVAHTPHLTALHLSASLTGDTAGRIALEGLSLHSDEVELDGHLTLVPPPQAATSPNPVSFAATLHAARLDADALRQGTRDDPHAPTASAPAPAPAPGPGPAPATAPVTSLGAPPGAPPGAPSPDRVLPFALLDRADGILDLHVDDLVADGRTYTGLGLHGTLASGRLSIDPFAVVSPQGPITGHLAVDAGTDTVALALHAPAIPAGVLTTLAPGWSDGLAGLSGTVQVSADLTATGTTPSALATTLGGTLGLSSVDATIPNTLLGDWIRHLGGGGAADAGGNGLAGLARGLTGGLVHLEPHGTTTLRCLAIASHLAAGVATLDPVALDTARLSATGHGTFTPATDVLDLHLLTSVLIGGTGATTPVRLSGTPGAVVAALEPGLPGGRFGIVIGGAADPCPAALDAARFGMPGPAVPARKSSRTSDVLRGLGLLR